MNERAKFTEWRDPRTHVKLERREPGLGAVYAVEGEGTTFYVMGVGFLTFLPGEPESIQDMCESLCRVSTLEQAVAGLVLAARAHKRSGGKRVEGDTHV
jgi:hypothetical protein